MPFEIVDIPLGGLNTKPDDFLLDPPGVSVLQDAQFDDLGGIQTRDQYQDILDAAGNTIADIRKIVANGDELVAFSKDKLWSYAEGDGLWTERADYLAVTVDEEARFVTNGDQFDCDRLEKDGITFYCWSETTPSATTSYIAAVDTATGAVKLSPAEIRTSSTTPRLVATTNSVILCYKVSTTFYVRAYDPSDLTSAETSTAFSAMVAYDAIQDPATPAQIIVAVSRAGFGYNIANYSETPAVSSNTNKARTADGAISVSFDSVNGDRLCVTYSNSTAVTSDILDASFVDVNVSVSTGTASSATVNQIASAYDALGVCYLFWSAGETDGSTGFETEVGAVNNAGSAVADATLAKRVGLASRAFLHDGIVYVWTAFASASQGDNVAQLQNSYLLYSVDGLLVAKAVHTQAGGFSETEGYLPGVQNLSGNIWAWCGGYRRIIPLGEGQKGYDAESPQDIVFEFDSNEARRAAKLGETLYVSGGLVSQYDGRGVYEVGFLTFPWDISAVPGGGGSNLNGTHNWKQTYFWQNAKGEVEHSSTTTRYSVLVSTNSCQLIGANLHSTAKKDEENHVANYWWRQVDTAAEGAPYFLVTSKDPGSTGSNKYIENDPSAYSTTTLVDDLTDTNLIQRQPHPENGGLALANLAPPSAALIKSTQDRLLLAGIPGNPHRVAYSKLRGNGEVASFNDYLSVDLPPDGGKITALEYLSETLVVFKERAVYLLPGDGYTNDTGGQNYGPARVINSDIGAISQETVALTPLGLIFKSLKGWQLLGNGLQVRYIGGPVEDFDSDTIVAVHAMADQHQVRCVSSGRTLVWDYLASPIQGQLGAWSEWTQGSVSACIWNNEHHVVNSGADGVMAQEATHSGAGDLPAFDLESGWIKLAGLQGYKLLRHLMFLTRYNGAHRVRVRVAYDYDDTWVDDTTHTPVTATAGDVEQFRHSVKRRRIQAFKVRLTAVGTADLNEPTTKGFDLAGISAKFAIQPGKQHAKLPATRKQ